MSSFMQKSKFCNSIIDELQDYMLFKHAIDEAFKSVVVIKSSERADEQKYKKEGPPVAVKTVGMNRCKPCQSDSLFWCFYVLLNGQDAYETVDRHFVVENEEKIKMIELLRANKKIIKEQKWRSNENDLSLTGQPISITTFATLCGLRKINVFYVDEVNRTFCPDLSFVKSDGKESDGKESDGKESNGKESDGKESDGKEGIGASTSEFVHVLYKSATSLRFECELNVPKASLMSACAGYYQIQSIHKPINAISSYTIKELTEMCKSLSLDHVLVKDNLGKSLSKQHLYQALCSKLGVVKDDPKVK
jgi:hypothetical protein